MKLNRKRGSNGRRGVALLLVMLGLVVCTILTTGFLASQGTSLGIARNERDAAKCRAIAQTGIDMVYWQIRNRSDWRTSMPVGNWLTNVAVGEGTLTVRVDDGDSTGSFSDDPSQGVTVTSTGTYSGRSFPLTASIRPTGGGTVFANGNFVNGNMVVGSDLLTAAQIDSYDSSSGSGSSGSNAGFMSNATGASALIVYFPSIFRGSYTAGPGSLLGNVLGLVGLGAAGPTSMDVSLEARNAGKVVFPNTTQVDATDKGAFSRINAATVNFNTEAKYSSFFVQGSTVNINASGLYHIAGNMTISSTGGATVNVLDGVNAVFVVDGTVSIGKTLQIAGSGQLAIYSKGSITVSGANVNTTGKVASRLIFFGSETCNAITVSGSAKVYGTVYAPQASMVMQTSSPEFSGAVAVKDLNMRNGSQLHFDEALRSLYISNIVDGSAPSGRADYRLTINGGPGIVR